RETLQAVDVRLDVAVPVRLESCDRAFEGHKRAPEPTPGELVQWRHHAAVGARSAKTGLWRTSGRPSTSNRNARSPRVPTHASTSRSRRARSSSSGLSRTPITETSSPRYIQARREVESSASSCVAPDRAGTSKSTISLSEFPPIIPFRMAAIGPHCLAHSCQILYGFSKRTVCLVRPSRAEVPGCDECADHRGGHFQGLPAAKLRN